MRELEVVTAAVAADGLARATRRKHRGEGGAADPGVKHANLHAECLNCGATLHGRYCQDCGQSDDDHHRSIFHLVWEAVEGLTHLDGRLMRTIPPLFLNPGKLAKDHFEGRRQRHVPPFRLFLITLLIFMFSLEVRTHHAPPPVPAVPAVPTAPGVAAREKAQDAAEAERPAEAIRDVARGVAGKPLENGRPHVSITTPGDPKLGHVIQVAPGVNISTDAPSGASAATEGFDQMSKSNFGQKPAGKWLVEHGRKANANKELFRATMFEWGHRLAILMLPIFAALLTLCYFYKRQFYIYDHLVVAMHFLSFVFLIWAIAYAVPDPAGGFLMLAATIWTPVNLFMTLRGAYGSSILGAGLKTFGLWVATLSLFLSLLLGVIFVAMGTL